MEIYFGRVPESYYEENEKYFVDQNGYDHYFKLIIDSANEEFTIQDTCNRYVPFPMEAAQELYTMLQGLSEFSNAIKLFKQKYNINE